MILSSRIRDLPGVLLRDIPRYRQALAHSGQGFRSDPRGWISLCNRIERLVREEGRPGVTCDWQWGSALHASQVLPSLNRRLLAAAMAEWPIRFSSQPGFGDQAPQVSFIFAHGGVDRLPQLVRTIQSVFAQSIPVECLVVDQTPVPIHAQLPAGVVYRHLDKRGVPEGWHKAWAYNVGARLARSPILVFHDGDVCAPSEYASEVLRTLGTGTYGAASLQRFLFYLSPGETRQLNLQGALESSFVPTMTFQNWKGGTIAVVRDAFFDMGGFDEGFVDWGGEDDEFYDRCSIVGHCRNGFLPFVHLWHAPQPERKSSTNPNIADVMPWRMAMPTADRVAELRARDWGSPERPDPMTSYKDQRAGA
jgi:hypothetical protein